ncbi:type VII secretion-associated protein [Mycolicibacterium flavescens]|uniref:Type VII secretion-associated protein n=1 Tax=Mycolicibacterium flavescens TaxID=1776 RepID=A0A1E3R8W4_MYCFV|nr:type VII secretion-associated protein [Mycolicibacterium flavescens]MCV7281981.1 type VII secretion-associated protein [Mycolicibacterium flavescens]ODQ85822.1 type VII secretion-associated protein [Mycolicibacterium flavescens]
MSAAVVEVGPAAVRGPGAVAAELVSAALAAVDDDLALVDDRAVPVPDLWGEVLGAAAAGADTVVLVCPTWWPTDRIDRIRKALGATEVEVITRTAAIDRARGETVVEIAAEVTVVTRPGAPAAVVPNLGPAVTDRVLAALGRSGPVVIDAPTGVPADALVEGLRKALGQSRIPCRLVGDEVLSVAPLRSSGAEPVAPRRRGVVLIVAAVAAVIGCGALLLRGLPEAPEPATELLTEGRVKVLVPAGWPVRRITSGPGSARLQIISPTEGDVSLHLTQSPGPAHADLAQTAAALRAALADEPADVFVDFNAADTVAGRAAVTYRELRADRNVRWAVVVDAGVRIAIGCQSATGREWAVREACDQAIRSAHARL